jgi:hypothetical protein
MTYFSKSALRFYLYTLIIGFIAILFLGEEIEFSIIFSIITVIFIFIIRTIYSNVVTPFLSEDPRNPQELFDFILKDVNFIKELSQLIEAEGGIYLFLKKIKPKMNCYNGQGENYVWDKGYKDAYFLENYSSASTPRIIDKIIEFDVCKKYFSKYDMSDYYLDLNAEFACNIFILITDDIFFENYANMLASANLDVSLARREMTYEEKLAYFDLED